MNIVYICNANICRSVMAEYITNKKIDEMKKNSKDKMNEEIIKNINNVKIFSAGTSALDGDQVPFEVKSVMKDEYGIDISIHRATNIRNIKINDMDLILCANTKHRDLIKLAYQIKPEKIYTIKEFVEYKREYHDDFNIKDPWGYEIEIYRFCASEIEECINKIIEKLVLKTN